MTKEEAIGKVKAYLIDCLPQEESDEIEEIVEALKQPQHWIPCSERLPDEDGDYLVLYDVYFINGDFAQRSVKVDQFFKELNAFCERFGEEEYIAWMPLPEFPRRSKDDID